ncbi:sensor histidine kinase [Paenibacillus filicis]|uniref:histidine kinase n=1 Tax=Paenibacillus gyeongsangnamensis TaxID=3388067 RepID=A0ABT4Q792_9BACL|nr:sensor histidine kinase [Paenibacillus filicis]MCZ8512741.1 sensor histidine kinase [Paenibacillus filicis]
MYRWFKRWIVPNDRQRVKSIQFVITVSFTLATVLVMLFVAFVLYNKFARTAEQNAYLSNQQIVEQVNYNLEIYLKGMADIFEQLDQHIRRSPSVPNDRLLEQLDTIMHTREDLVSLALFTTNGTPLTGLPNEPLRTTSRVTEQSWFRAAMDNPNHLAFSVPHIQNLYKGEYKWVVSMSKMITIDRGGTPFPVVLLVDINFKTIDELLHRVSLGKKGYVYIIDESAGNIIYHPQQQLIYIGLKYENVEQALKYTYGSYEDLSTGEKRLITIKTVSSVGWKVIGVSYMDEIMTTQKEISGFISWLLLFVVVFVLFISAYMSARISLPIKRLEKSMRKVEQGEFDIHLPVSGEDEVGRLSRRFNLMVGRIGQLMDQIIEEQEAKRKNELEVLQSQIHPHFLYNTLNSVVRMAGTGKTEEVVTMITSLSKFFRISLSRGKHIISVQEELEHVRNYLVIQKIRYKNQFEYEIEAEPEVLVCRTLKLILQPLVENAIYHGIEMMQDTGLIRITAAAIGGRLRLQVQDNGLGIPPGKLEHLLTGPSQPGEGSGVGLRNVHDRIRLYYGEEYGLQVESEREEGTTVMIWMPIVREEANE